ncbi:MAG: hypothetical protein ACXWTP_11740 [Methylosarcina sp.]
MTTSARLVLEDCEEAATEIDSGVQGSAWRRRWITSVVLLRAVGHVLDKVDSSQSVAHKLAIDAAWKSLQQSRPKPAIFWGFIEDERNSILKEYKLSAGQGVTVRPGGVSVNLVTGEQHASEGLPPIYHYVINDGPFKGRDQRHVLREAIEWWRSYLDAIDSKISGP